jgi:hypothetical protein
MKRTDVLLSAPVLSLLALVSPACHSAHQKLLGPGPRACDPVNGASTADCTMHQMRSCDSTPSGGMDSRIRYQAPSAPAGSACAPETQTRTCTDGAWSDWSGSFAFEACSVDSGTCPGGDLLFDVQPIGAGAQCANGGQRARSGTDLNHDCQLNDDEVLSIAYLCAPTTAKNLLLAVAKEPAGTACPKGGLAVRAGIDQNGDGQLGDDEVETTPFVCNGVEAGTLVQRLGTAPADSRCAAGGVHIDDGLDGNANGALDDSEQRDADFVCFTAPGRARQLVKLSDVAAGSCPKGGKHFATGVDKNGDGRLGDDEIAAANQWCRPGSAATGLVSRLFVETDPPPTLCEGSGRSIVSGIDVNKNGQLDDPEILRLAPLCDPINGAKWRPLAGRMSLPLTGLAQGLASRPWAAGQAGMWQYDGGTFSRAAGLPPLGLDVARDSALVAPLGDSDVWIYFGGGATGTYFYHWEGSTWSLTPWSATVNSPVGAIAVPDSDGTPTLIAAASGGSCGGISGDLLQWTELGWKELTSSCSVIPLRLGGTAVNDLWVASRSPTGDPTGIQHWDGKAWNAAPQPAADVQSIVALGPKAAWAVGAGGAALQWDGAQWTAVPTGLTNALDAVTITQAQETWLGGTGGKIIHRVSGNWQDASLPIQEAVTGLWAESNSAIWAITGGSGSIYRWDGQAWSAKSAPFDARDLRGAWAPAAGELWAVGNKGLVVHAGNQGPLVIDVGVQVDLQDIWGAAPDDFWIVGASGTMLHYDGNWTPFKTPESGNLTRVWGTSASNVWAIGDGGILQWNATTKAWSRVNPTPKLRAIGGTDQQVWFVGDTTIVTFTGGAFQHVPVDQTTPGYRAVWFAGPGDGWVASTRAQLFRFDGTNAPTPSPTTSSPYGRLWGLSSNEVYAVGSSFAAGPVQRWDGALWSNVNGLSAMQAIAGRGSRDLWAVGNYGMLLRYE